MMTCMKIGCADGCSCGDGGSCEGDCSCDGGGSCEGDCSCGEPDPYQEETQVIWKTPTDYDPLRDGPPYLPSRLASSQRQGVKDFVRRQAAFYSVQPVFEAEVAKASVESPLTMLLAFLQAVQITHQSHHWNTKGAHYYGDHLLFDRIYDGLQEEIDRVAERALGSGSVDCINEVFQAAQVLRVLKGLSSLKVQEGSLGLVQKSLKAELYVLGVISSTKKILEQSGQLTDGIDDLLQGIANKHETAVYLLKQRVAGGVV